MGGGSSHGAAAIEPSTTHAHIHRTNGNADLYHPQDDYDTGTFLELEVRPELTPKEKKAGARIRKAWSNFVPQARAARKIQGAWARREFYRKHGRREGDRARKVAKILLAEHRMMQVSQRATGASSTCKIQKRSCLRAVDARSNGAHTHIAHSLMLIS